MLRRICQSRTDLTPEDAAQLEALRSDEPAVYHALEMQVPVRDLKAVTQENCTVRQDAVPVFAPDQRCIAALIQEKDISGRVRQEKKFEELGPAPVSGRSGCCGRRSRTGAMP